MQFVNKLTGEILDLKLLARPSRAKRTVKRYQRKQRGTAGHWLFIGMAGVLAMWITIIK